MIKRVVPSLIATCSYEHPWSRNNNCNNRVEEEPRGFLIMDVIAGSPADKAVLHGDNRITNIDKEEN